MTEAESLTSPGPARFDAHRFDARGWSGWEPSLYAQIALSQIPPGEVLEVISSEPDTKSDLELWAGRRFHEFLGVIPGSGYERIFVRRAGISPRAPPRLPSSLDSSPASPRLVRRLRRRLAGFFRLPGG